MTRLGRLANCAVVMGFLIGATTWAVHVSRRSTLFAFAINWALMGLAYIVWSVFPVRVGRRYYDVHRFERSGRLYERFGVRVFQRCLRVSGLDWLGADIRRGGRARARTILSAAVENAETAHLLIVMSLAIVSAIFAMWSWWETAAWLLFFTVLLNAYPVLSLRYVRVRGVRLFLKHKQDDGGLPPHCRQLT